MDFRNRTGFSGLTKFDIFVLASGSPKHMIQFPQVLEQDSRTTSDGYSIQDTNDREKFVQYMRAHLGDSRLVHREDPFSSLEAFDSDYYQGIVCDYPLNGIRKIDDHLIELNKLLRDGEHLVIIFEPQASRRSRILESHPRLLGYLYYYTWDFFFHRMCARMKETQGLYFKVTKGKNQVISVPEALGRLISCGFDIVDYNSMVNKTFVITKKSEAPNPVRIKSSGPIIRLERIGYKGRKIQVLKMRTMRPYSQYLQKYLFDTHGTLDGDKIKNDFRVTGWGAHLRKFWLDELPMLWNWLKRDLKLVGIRPLSQHKFDTYPEHLRALRIQTKPGMVPPYYADMPQTQEEFFASEEKYLREYLKSPIKTDIKYFFKAFNNILFKGARSK